MTVMSKRQIRTLDNTRTRTSGAHYASARCERCEPRWKIASLNVKFRDLRDGENMLVRSMKFCSGGGKLSRSNESYIITAITDIHCFNDCNFVAIATRNFTWLMRSNVALFFNVYNTRSRRLEVNDNDNNE